MKLSNGHLALYEAIQRRGLSGGCSDISREELKLVTNDEWIEFCKSYHDWNGDPEDFDPKRPVLADFCVVDFVQELLITFYKEHNK
jgi:hypothetical protein